MAGEGDVEGQRLSLPSTPSITIDADRVVGAGSVEGPLAVHRHRMPTATPSAAHLAAIVALPTPAEPTARRAGRIAARAWPPPAIGRSASRR